MSLPLPRNGLVIRYAFLWSHEADTGATEARKDRPAAIVLASRTRHNGDVSVLVAPITHSAPADPTASLAIPRAVSRDLGLDGKRHWIRFDELNRFVWPGFDLRPIPGRPGQFAYGMLPAELYEELRKGILALQRSRAARPPERR